LNGITSVPKFNENLPAVRKFISGGHTDKQTGDLISLLLFLESRLIKIRPVLELLHAVRWTTNKKARVTGPVLQLTAVNASSEILFFFFCNLSFIPSTDLLKCVSDEKKYDFS
jgi:hypothetical protein